MSHSIRVRGLKSFWRIKSIMQRWVALYTSAWIEISDDVVNTLNLTVALYTSAWIEIINPNDCNVWSASRTLYECVDWNQPLLRQRLVFRVALYTSAWIEMPFVLHQRHEYLVALYTSAWIEIDLEVSKDKFEDCRTLYECVDWNNRLIQGCCDYLRSHSIRVRGLKSLTLAVL